MKKLLLSICLCLSIAFFASGQKKALVIADSLLKCGKHFEASVWYERCLFEGEANPSLCTLAIKGKIACLKAEKKFDEEIDFITRSRALDIPDSFRQHLAYDEMLACYLKGSFGSAIEDANNLDTLTFSYDEIRIAKTIIILSYDELCRWKDADSVYGEYLDRYLGTNTTATQRSLYSTKPKLKSENKARLLSNLFPGLGQVYAGKPLEGITNMLLQIGTLWFSVNAWEEGYHLTSLLVGGSSFEAFRSGGKRRAMNLVKQHNAKIIDKYNDYLRRELMLSYVSKKV